MVMLPNYFILLLFIFPIISDAEPIDFYEIKLALKYDLSVYPKLKADRISPKDWVRRVILIVNNVLASARTVIVIVDGGMLQNSPLQGGSIYEDFPAINLPQYYPIEPNVDFFQVWTAKVYPNTAHAFGSTNKVCGPHAFSLISVVNNEGNLVPEEEIAHLVLKTLTINMNMGERTLPCKCNNCVTSYDSTGPGKNYLKLPDCAAKFINDTFTKNPCTQVRNQGKRYTAGLNMCGNGVIEMYESCDCRPFDDYCPTCCNMESCIKTNAEGCRYTAVGAPIHPVTIPATTRKPTTKQKTDPPKTTEPPVKTTIPPTTRAPTTRRTTIVTTPKATPQSSLATTTRTSPKHVPGSTSTSKSNAAGSTTAAPATTNNGTTNNGTTTGTNAAAKDITWIIITLVMVILIVLVIIGATVFFVLKKKKGSRRTRRSRRPRPASATPLVSSRNSLTLPAPAPYAAAVPLVAPRPVPIIVPKIARRKSRSKH
jgi:hypothetical protein